MGINVLYNLWSSVMNANVSGAAHWLAITGICIVAAVAIGYGVAGFIKLVKLISSMKVKKFSLLLLAIGFALLGIAVALP